MGWLINWLFTDEGNFFRGQLRAVYFKCDMNAHGLIVMYER